MSLEMKKIASALESIAEEGIVIHIRFPDHTDKFVTDLPAMKISEALKDISKALCQLDGR